jgi:DNA modification methylase
LRYLAAWHTIFAMVAIVSRILPSSADITGRSARMRSITQYGHQEARMPKPKRASEAKIRLARPVHTHIIWCGDNLDYLRKLPDACIDLIYIDPPFNSNRNYEVFWGEDHEGRTFDDRHASTTAYLNFMRPRCVELHRVLKDTGSFYYHCDDHASHYVKVMLDQIFGASQFQNEIVWKRTGARGDGYGWNQLHDTLFLFTKSSQFVFNRQYEPYRDEYVSDKYRHDDGDGRKYMLDNMTSPNPRPNMTYEWKGFPPPPKGWRYSRETMAKLDSEGRIWYPDDKTKRPRLKRYLSEMPGIPMGSVWTDIAPLNSQARERVGYPTQKPIPLLESNKGNIVLDAFCGCGTTLEAAELLDRSWIGIDISPKACRVMADRIKDRCKLEEGEPLWNAGRGFIVRNLPWTEDRLRAVPAVQFQNWAVTAIGGVCNKNITGDMGIDGKLYIADDAKKGSGIGKQLEFMYHDYFPVQVKQKDKAGRPDIDSFETAMVRDKKAKGFFVSFGFTKDAEIEIRRAKREQSLEIVPITVEEILEDDERRRVG